MMFSRLEAREILHHLGPDCDPDVVTKLQQLAQSKGTTVAPLTAEQAATVHRFVEETEARDPRAFIVPPKPFVPPLREHFPHLLDDEFAAHVRGLEAGYQQDVTKSKLIAMESMAPAAVPLQHVIERIPKGGKNRAGDLCIDVRGGISIFQCTKEGHGYTGNNPAVIGCTVCALGGNTQANNAEAAELAHDPGAIDGVDSRW